MAQYDINLREYWRIIRKRKAIVILTTIVLILFSIVMSIVRAPSPLYEATCSVKFEKSVSPLGIYTKIISWGPGSEIETQIAVIKSYPVFTKVAEALGRINKPEGTDAAVGRIISGLQSQVKVSQEGNSSIVNITATAKRPAFAAALANQVALAYKETRALEVNQRIAEAIKFIKNQLEIVRQRLKRSEDRLREFRESEDIVALPAQSSNLLARVNSVETKLAEAVEAKMELQDVLRRIKKASRHPLSSKKSYSSDKASTLYQRLNSRLVDLMLKRDSLLIQYTSSHPQIIDIDKQISEITRKMIRELESHVKIQAQKEKTLRREVNLIKAEIQALPTKGLELARLEGDVDRTSEIYSLLESKYQEALIQDAERPDEVTIIRPAIEPSKPINPPNTASSGLLGAMIGLVLGLVFAFIVETLDTSLGAIDDVEETLGLPVVGLIPHVGPGDDRAILIPHFSSQSVLAESFRSLRTNLQFSALENNIKTIVVTSATPLEGKTVVAGNLAIAMAQGGLKTLLVSTDLRKPTLYKLFGLDASPGLTDFLLGNGDYSETIKTVTDLMMGKMGVDEIMLTSGMDNLHILTCGKIPSNPAELIESEKFKDLLEALYSHYDVILMDTPPLISAADASILATKADSVLLVYRAGEVARGILKRVKAQLDQVKAHIIGVVLNGVKAELSPDFEELRHYKYYYYYGGEAKTRKTEKKKRIHRPLSLLLLSMALVFSLAGLLWQNGILDFDKYVFKNNQVVKKSSIPLSPVKIVKPEKTDTSAQTGSFETTSPPASRVSEGQVVVPIKIDAYPETDSVPIPPPNPPPRPVHYPYSLMTGSFKTLQQVNKALSFLREQGLVPWWSQVDLGKRGIWFGVCVGHFETAEEAKEFRESFGLNASKVVRTAYTNKIGDFTSKEEIKEKLTSLRKAGYSPYVIEAPQEVYRLFIGGYVTKEGAEEMARILNQVGIDNEVVLR
jgi:succinoglycan biosynthesis transport protein ExoP